MIRQPILPPAPMRAMEVTVLMVERVKSVASLHWMRRRAAIQHIEKEIVPADLATLENHFAAIGRAARRAHFAKGRAGSHGCEEFECFDTERAGRVSRGIATANHGATDVAVVQEIVQHLTKGSAKLSGLVSGGFHCTNDARVIWTTTRVHHDASSIGDCSLGFKHLDGTHGSSPGIIGEMLCMQWNLDETGFQCATNLPVGHWRTTGGNGDDLLDRS